MFSLTQSSAYDSLPWIGLERCRGRLTPLSVPASTPCPKVVAPTALRCPTRLRDRRHRLQECPEPVAQPFDSKLTRQDLNRLAGQLLDCETGQRRARATASTSPNLPGEVP